jgi:hypothetical protein
MAEKDFTTSEENRFSFTLDEVDEINAKLGEALAMAEVLAGHGGDNLDHLGTYTAMIQERLEDAHRLFNKKAA